MVKEINNLGGFTPPRTTTKQSDEQTDAPAAPVAETQSTKGDEVQISDSAKTLQTLASKVNSLPEVNIERAEQIKAALESGEYHIDDLVLADKILNSEALLDS